MTNATQQINRTDNIVMLVLTAFLNPSSQGRSYIGGTGGAAPPLAISQSANQVKVTLSRQIEKIPEICTLS